MGRLVWSLLAVTCVIVVVASCGGGSMVNNTSGTTGSGGVSTTSSSSSGTTSSGMGGHGGTGGAIADGGPDASEAGVMCKAPDPSQAAAIAAASCAMSPPAGAAMPPPPKAYTGGTCPKLVAYDGTTAMENTIMSMGNARTFAVAVPKNLQPNEVLPVIFLWYWLKGTENDFYTRGDIQNAVDNQRFIAVLPHGKGDQGIIPGVNLDLVWPYAVTVTQARQDEEYVFFDDMLSCVSQQFNVNLSCVSTAGVSAGALWTDQLIGARSEYLSSFISLSGGVGGFIKPYASPPPPHVLPGIVLWGGPTDNCIIINFQTCSQTLEKDLLANCNFMVECIHNCGHGEPPFDPDAGSSLYAGLWQFAFDHPYWLPAGASPYTTKGLPSDMPSWCSIGAGTAVPRTGACNPPGC